MLKKAYYRILFGLEQGLMVSTIISWKIFFFVFLGIIGVFTVVSYSAPGSSVSASWTGYIAPGYSPGPSVTQVNGSWFVQPAASYSGATYSTQWVGIGGIESAPFNDTSLIQVGTGSDYDTGSPPYYAWYELIYPNNYTKSEPHNISNSIINVKVGDDIVASVSLTGGENAIECAGKACSFNIYIKDITTDQSNTVYVSSYNSSLKSADWIDERPGTCPTGCIYHTLSDFGMAYYGSDYTFQSGTNYAIINSVREPVGNFFGVFLINLTENGPSGGPLIATPSNLTPDNSSFRITDLGNPPLTPRWASFSLGPIIAFAGSSVVVSEGNVIGGSGVYAYQWLELPPLAHTFTNSTDCLPANAVSCTFATNALTTPGLYVFKLHVTDLATLEAANSSNIIVYVKPPINLPKSIYSYVPINVINNQSAPTPPGFQQEIIVNSSAYRTLEAGNLQNIEFTYPNYIIIPSWLQSTGNSNSSQQTVYWLDIANAIPAYDNMTIWMDFANKTTNLFNNVTTGEAPDATPIYGQYDNGNNIFPIYDNFAGDVLNPQWTVYNSSNSSITVDNGTTFKTNGGGTYAALVHDTAINSSQYFEDLSYNISNQAAGVCGIGVAYGMPFGIGEFPAQSANSSGLVYTDYYISASSGGSPYCEYDSVYVHSYGIEYTAIDSNTASSGALNQNPPGSIFGMDWITNTTSYLTCTGQDTYCPFNLSGSLGIGDAPSSVYPGLGMINYAPLGNSTTAIGSVMWARTRDVPPNGIMPQTVFDPLHRFLNLTLQTNVALEGRTVEAKLSGITNGDTISMLINGQWFYSGVYSGSSLIYNISDSLAPGTYNLTLIDNTTNTITNQTLTIDLDPTVTVTPANSTIDGGQYVALQANPVNGTGAFSYQWYNDTGGSQIAITNATYPTLIVNGSASGDFSYSVELTDVNPNGNYVVSSNNAPVVVEPAISIYLTKTINNSTVSINSAVHGGTGNFTYQWYNSTNLQFQLPIANQTSSSMEVLVPNNAIYNYSVLVTDQGTTTSPKWAIESEAINTIISKITIPQHIVYYVQIGITNAESSATASGFQQMLVVNSSNYTGYEAQNLQNIEFSYQNGTTIPSWLESGNSNTSTETIYWLKLDTPIPAHGSQTVWMEFANRTTNLFNNVTTGVAPQLSSIYGQYDNGNYVFPASYWNFVGTSCPSGWSCTGTYTIDNGIISVGTGGTGSVTTTSGAYGDNAMQILDYGISTPASYSGNSHWLMWGYVTAGGSALSYPAAAWGGQQTWPSNDMSIGEGITGDYYQPSAPYGLRGD